MILLAPSILAADFSRLGEEIAEADQAGADYIHLDVMDGKFVPSISFGMPVIAGLRSVTKKVFDVHLMIEEPDRYIADFVAAGADIITVHLEACCHLDRTIHKIKEQGVKAAVALNPATPIGTLQHILPDLDMVLLMSVNPGFGGQSYIPYMTDKIRALRTELQARGLKTDIQVDGGITLSNAPEVILAGANIIVAGSSVFKGSAAENIRDFQDIFKRYQ